MDRGFRAHIFLGLRLEAAGFSFVHSGNESSGSRAAGIPA
jgi:hypothetical protein